MSYNSSASEEQQQLPEVFRRLGKTVPPRERRSYSGSQPPQGSGFRFVRPFQAKPHYPPPNDFHHANYNNIVIQASIPSPPLYHRPQMNNENNTMGFHTTFRSNGNNNNNNNNSLKMDNTQSIPVPYHSPASSSISSSTPLSSSPLPPQNGFSFIPKDTNSNPNPIISFIRNPNTGAMPSTAYSTPYQFFGNGNVNQVSMNSGQQVLHPSPPVAASAPVSNVATTSADVSSAPPPSPQATISGASVVSSSSSNAKKESTASSSDKKTSSPSTSSSRKSEQTKLQKRVPNDHGSSDENQEEAPFHQRDILAKSIKIIASRPLGSADKTSCRKHTRHSDSEISNGSDEEIIVNRKIVVASDDMDLDCQSNGRNSSPIRKKQRRLISPTIPERRTSLSDGSDDDDSPNTKSRYIMRSPSPMSEDRHRRSLSRTRSRSRARSRSRSLSPLRQTRQRRRSVSFARQDRDHSPGSSSDEELAPFLRREADRYVPDYHRRPLPPQWRKKSPPARKPPSLSPAETNAVKKSSSSSSPLAKKSASTNSNMSINDRLNQDRPKDLRSYPPLGTSPMSFNNPRSRAEAETSPSSKQSSAKKSSPLISHNIITKCSPSVAKAKSTSAAASSALNTKKNASPASEAAQSTLQPNGTKPDSTNSIDNDTNLIPIKQETTTQSIIEQPKPVATLNKVRNIDAMAGIETPSRQTTPAMSMDGSASVTRVNHGHASPDTSSNKPTAVYAPKATVAAETTAPHQQRKRKAFSDTLIGNDAEANANVSTSSPATSFVKPLVNGTPTNTLTATTTINATSTTPSPAVSGSSQPAKRATITPEARAAIRKRAAKEQERLDQERLRQLDIEDRDDIVMDIACPASQYRSSAVTMANKDPVMNVSENQINKSTELMQTMTTMADPTNMTPYSPKRNNDDATTNDEQVAVPIVNHPTLVLNMTNPENAPSPDTTTAVGTNSAFTNLATSSDNMSVPDGNITEQTKSMPLQTLPPASSSSSSSSSILEAPIAHVSIAVAAAAVTKPAAKKNSRRRLPTPWKVKMNDSGDIYYHNPVTGEETFARPE
ncbi:ER membrane protein DP1/Yop1 [Mucor velutinosus]|uniref:ER membrane protein DP1/Yop1 n=1 Tax=Mucor velutinosus TaxID=708070 RepID=A0AAN7DS61_9FUNG|nr:ER membrane protein DP1/Yop1 [Mucor velutinosus]